MTTRREFLRITGAGALAALGLGATAASCPAPAPRKKTRTKQPSGPWYQCICGRGGPSRTAINHKTKGEPDNYGGPHIVKKVR